MVATEQLSERELELLKLVATGASNKEIAQKLFISTNTVKVHLRNIFAKTGVTSRTEATLYAIKNGLVAVDDGKAGDQVALQPNTVVADVNATETTPKLLDMPASLATMPINVVPTSQRVRYLWLAVPLSVLAIIIASFALTLRQSSTVALASPVVPTVASRWQQKSAMPTSRSGLATTSYEGKIYAIGGETDAFITSAVESYDPVQDKWTRLESKPLAVTDVSAGVIAGKIYVPGGRLSDGSFTNSCEVYDPKENLWSQMASLPNPLAGYALVSFEGKLYLFGGNNQNGVTDTVYIYDPGRDVWLEGTPMPSARAFAGAAIAGGKIFVVGGYDGNKILNTNDEYVPERDHGKESPWQVAQSLPNGRYFMGVAGIADIIYVVGGIGEKNTILTPLEYFYQQNRWQSVDDSPLAQNWSRGALVPIETFLYSIGGKIENKTTTANNFAYRAIYTVIIPQFR